MELKTAFVTCLERSSRGHGHALCNGISELIYYIPAALKIFLVQSYKSRSDTNIKAPSGVLFGVGNVFSQLVPFTRYPRRFNSKGLDYRGTGVR